MQKKIEPYRIICGLPLTQFDSLDSFDSICRLTGSSDWILRQLSGDWAQKLIWGV